MLNININMAGVAGCVGRLGPREARLIRVTGHSFEAVCSCEPSATAADVADMRWRSRQHRSDLRRRQHGRRSGTGTGQGSCPERCEAKLVGG